MSHHDHRHLHAVPGGPAQEPAPVNGRPGRVVVPQDDGAPPGVLTAQLHKGRAKEPVRLQLDGELDLSRADEFRRAIDVAWSLGTGRLVVHLRGVVFMDLTSVQVLLNAQREASKAACSLAIIVGDAAEARAPADGRPRLLRGGLRPRARPRRPSVPVRRSHTRL